MGTKQDFFYCMLKMCKNMFCSQTGLVLFEKNALALGVAERQRHINPVKVTLKWLLSSQLPQGKHLLQRKEKFQLSRQRHTHTHTLLLSDRPTRNPPTRTHHPIITMHVSSVLNSIVFYRIVQLQCKFEIIVIKLFSGFINTQFHFIAIPPCFCLFVFIS